MTHARLPVLITAFALGLLFGPPAIAQHDAAACMASSLDSSAPDESPDATAETPADAMLVEVWRHVATRFYDPDLSGINWNEAFLRHCPDFIRAKSPDGRAAVVNAMLEELNASHTRLYTPDMPKYYQLLGVFLPNVPTLADEVPKVLTDGRPRYAGIGIEVEEIAGRAHVRGVLHGGPAAKAGILRGDEIVSVNDAPFHPIQSFAGQADRTVTLQLRRFQGADVTEITVGPRMLDGAGLFLDALEASIAIEARDGLRIGYARLWSYGGQQYQALLEGELLYGRLKDADALVLDLRGGWGGASPTYLNLFRDRAVTVAMSDRAGHTREFASAWSRPVVLLVDGTSSSGKELMAHGFQTLGIGPVVGARTRGAVLAGRLIPLSDDSILYLAVQDIRVNGRRLEGIGVMPDVVVRAPLAFAAGADPQRDTALDLAAQAARES